MEDYRKPVWNKFLVFFALTIPVWIVLMVCLTSIIGDQTRTQTRMLEICMDHKGIWNGAAMICLTPNMKGTNDATVQKL